MKLNINKEKIEKVISDNAKTLEKFKRYNPTVRHKSFKQIKESEKELRKEIEAKRRSRVVMYLMTRRERERNKKYGHILNNPNINNSFGYSSVDKVKS